MIEEIETLEANAQNAIFPMFDLRVPVFAISKQESTVHFSVKESVAIDGKFDKWDATLTFSSPEPSTGVLDIKIQADSVDTGSGMKDGKLKSKDFFDAEHAPFITFHSTKVEQTVGSWWSERIHRQRSDDKRFRRIGLAADIVMESITLIIEFQPNASM